ncbi:N-acetylmuramoyl-L-alanine amidase, partial [Serratia marcescens]|uniref:N-acetylmuramoyl-L-alanine amidase n=1 Tax=Serratia marcescens TaxID=615 RepID=UPI0019540627
MRLSSIALAMGSVKRADLDARSNLARAGTVSAHISIHVNAGSPGSRGAETYYFGQPMSSLE